MNLTSKIKKGDANDFSNFMTAVIDQRAFDKITGYIERARENPNCEIITGGNYDDSDKKTTYNLIDF